jgi:DnaJ-class molecular chaperone
LARDPYQELGVSRAAAADDIRKAFRKLAKANHPDTNPGNKSAEERFKRVSAAFDIVGDPEKRKKFDAGLIDADGREVMGAGFGGDPWGSPGAAQGQRGGFRPEGMDGVDLGDILGEMFGGVRQGRAGGRAGAGGVGGGFGGFSQRGADTRARLEVDLVDAIRGGRQRIAFSDGRTIDVTIPKGAQDGQTLRLKGQGAPGRSGPGDAFIEITLKPHAVFRREADALVMDLPITLYDAVLGGKVEAPTPDGPVTITVPRGSNSGAMLRLKARGLYDAKGQRGDLFARLVIMLPEPPDPALEAFAQEQRTKRPYSPRRRG